MNQINSGGNIGGIQQTQALTNADINDKSLSIADLNMMVMLERSDILDKQLRQQIDIVHTKNDKIRQLTQIQAKLMNQNSQTAAVSENTWTIDREKNPKEIALDNGYKIQIHGKNEKWSIIDAEGNKTDIWGDPHVNEGDKEGTKNWDFHEDATFLLPDGTKITCKCIEKGKNGDKVFSDELIITKANQSIHVTGIANNKPQIGQPTLDGGKMDAATNDGYIFKMGDQADDWLYKGNEITSDPGKLKNITEEGEKTHEETLASNTASSVEHVLSQEERDLLQELGVTLYDASGVGMLTPEEISNLEMQLKGAKETLTSTSQMDMMKLQSLTGKYEQTNAMASQVLKQLYSQAKEIIRNI